MYTRIKSKFQIRQVKLGFIVMILLLFLSLPIWNGRQAHAQQDKTIALDGVWRLRGYGKILHIYQGNYTNYDITEISCVQESNGILKDFMQRYGRLAINDSGQLLLSTIGGITRYTYDRLNTLPEYCQNDRTSRSTDPEFNFEVFYHIFEENYPFFKL
ncbi:MAG: hypothetical protein JXB26_05160, partial [Candidatus Aminicenantes bacterium]|nr:hypothetical protein [Candidatus Aminicenantes bacterium]